LLDVDLAQLDGRLKATKISGSIESKTQASKPGQSLIVSHAQLSEPRARLKANIEYLLTENRSPMHKPQRQ